MGSPLRSSTQKASHPPQLNRAAMSCPCLETLPPCRRNQDIRPTPRHIGGCLPHTPCDHPNDSCTHHVPCSMRDNSPNNKIVRIYIFTYIHTYIYTYVHINYIIIYSYIKYAIYAFNLLNMLLKY